MFFTFQVGPLLLERFPPKVSQAGQVLSEGAKNLVQVLCPIHTTGLSAADVDDLTQQVRQRMLQEMETLTEIARGQGIAMSASQARKLQ